MSNVIDPTAFRTGDTVHVRGKILEVDMSSGTVLAVFDENCEEKFYFGEIVAHIPAIRSWSEIQTRIAFLAEKNGLTFNDGQAFAEEIIALLNEIDPKGDAR